MFLLINKSKGITSFGVVNQLRKITSINKIGHGGTLDPNATGLLIIGIGRESTKQLSTLTEIKDKEYEAEITLGEERDTDDVEGKTIKTSRTQVPTILAIKKVLKSFLGEQMQTPPKFSAIKLKGRKAYELSRKGHEVVLAKRKINIYSLTLIKYKFPKLIIKTKVSKGTYIRALARDLGRKLGTYAYLENLKRTKIGKFKLSNSVGLSELTSDNWMEYTIESLS